MALLPEQEEVRRRLATQQYGSRTASAGASSPAGLLPGQQAVRERLTPLRAQRARAAAPTLETPPMRGAPPLTPAARGLSKLGILGRLAAGGSMLYTMMNAGEDKTPAPAGPSSSGVIRRAPEKPTSRDFTGEPFSDASPEVTQVARSSSPAGYSPRAVEGAPSVERTGPNSYRTRPGAVPETPPVSAGAPGGTAAPEQQVRGWVVDSSGRRTYDDTPVPTGGFTSDLGGPTGDMGITEMLAAGSRQRTAAKTAAAGALERGTAARARMEEEGRTARAAGAQAGENTRQGIRLSAASAEAEKARGAVSPLREAQTRLTGAQSGTAEAAAKEAGIKARLLEKLGDVEFQKEDPESYKNIKSYYDAQYGRKPTDSAERAAYIRQGIDPDTMQPLEGFAEGGMVEGYAAGGAIRGETALHPAIAQYGQYLQAATSSGVPPITFDQFSALQTGAKSAAGTPPAPGTPSPMTPPGVPGFAGGGAIPVAGKLLDGPGTGTSDSIPAVIDGVRPAGLSSGEFVIPEKVVRAKGTEFFEKLIAQYAEDAKNGK